MTVETELIKIGGGRFINGSSMLVVPEHVMSSEMRTTIPTEADLFADTSVQLYPIGTKLYINDKIYRYCRAGAAMTDRGFLKGNYTQIPGKAGNSASSGYEAALYAAASSGDTHFDITDTAATKNLYEGGYVVFYDDTNAIYDDYRVIGNDATDATSTIVYISKPGLVCDHAAAVQATLYQNPYYNIRSMATVGTYGSALGYAKFSIASGYFFWLQTAGLISGVTGASTWPGQTASQRDCFCNTDGSLIGITSTTYLYQRVGFLVGRTASDYGDNWIMLQLDQ